MDITKQFRTKQFRTSCRRYGIEVTSEKASYLRSTRGETKCTNEDGYRSLLSLASLSFLNRRGGRDSLRGTLVSGDSSQARAKSYRNSGFRGCGFLCRADDRRVRN